MKEYDLVNELGKANWIDAVAGEAVILGFTLRDPELEVMGTELSKLIGEVHYDNDQFFKVVAFAKGLEERMKRILEEKKNTVFIDNVRSDERTGWPSRDWEYDFLHLKRYQIWLNLPNYDDKRALLDSGKLMVEESVLKCFSDPSFESYHKTVTEETNQGQKFVTTLYTDHEGKVIRKIVNHDHADSEISKGWLEKFYFDDFATAMEAWRGVRQATSGRKR